MHKCHCKDNCDPEDRERCGNLCCQLVGSATDTNIEPVNLERDRRIENEKRLHDLKLEDEKKIKEMK